jgi:hypothetical protein
MPAGTAAESRVVCYACDVARMSTKFGGLEGGNNSSMDHVCSNFGSSSVKGKTLQEKMTGGKQYRDRVKYYRTKEWYLLYGHRKQLLQEQQAEKRGEGLAQQTTRQRSSTCM